MQDVQILKTKVNILTVEGLHREFKRLIDSKKKGIVDYLNIYSANIAFENKWFRDFINNCDVVICDGRGIQLSANLLGIEKPEQIAYNRWLWDFFTFCEQENYSIFFLGAEDGVVEKAIDKIVEKGYNLRVGGHHGYFNKTNGENDVVLSQIDRFQPDFLIVGLGMPIQEKWVSDNFDRINAKVVILGGAYLDWISGSVKVPPIIISKIGMEWLYRLALEPNRLARRYLIGIPQFFFRVLNQKFSSN